MEQTNVVQMPEQKPEEKPWERNRDIPTEQDQLLDLEKRLEKQMQTCRGQVVTLTRLEKTLNEHNHTWRSIFSHMQNCGLDIVTRDDIESEVADIVSMSSDVVNQNDLEETVKESIDNLTFSVTVE